MSEKSLLTRCKNGEPEGWRIFYQNYFRAVYRWALYFGSGESGAEEITQEVFTTAAKKISTCRFEAQAPAWLFQITRRHVANYRRNLWFKNVFGVAPEQRDEQNTALEETARSENKTISIEIMQTLKLMPLKYAEILVFHYFEGYSHEEIADFIKIPTGTVASRLNKAKDIFKRFWNQEENYGA